MADSDSDTISSDGSELYELDHLEDPMRRRIPIDSSSPEPWTDIATRIKPHLRCSVPCLERLREKRTFVQSVRYQELVCDAADRRRETREEEETEELLEGVGFCWVGVEDRTQRSQFVRVFEGLLYLLVYSSCALPVCLSCSLLFFLSVTYFSL